VYNLPFHQVRFERTQKDLFGIKSHLQLRNEIDIPKRHRAGLVKCRIIYDETIQNIEFEHYHLKNIQTLKLVDFSDSYTYKYEDRKSLDLAYRKKEECDDVILIKEDYVTDSYYGNLAFKKGDTWYTPKHCLLKGTRREQLLRQDRIHIKKIRASELGTYSHVSLFNAMIPFKQIKLQIKNIIH